MDSRAFYDGYVERQLRVGVNQRHRSILRWLRRFGLERDHRVLEVGAGVGTLTGLLADALGPGGSLLAVDLSPRSIEAARERLGGRTGVRLRVADVLSEELEGPFDVIVLPDVLEHIPGARRPELFRRLGRWLDAEGFLLLHYPNPHYLAWCREHRPDLLQLVDEPVWPEALTAAAHPAGLTLEHLETYSIWIREGDYQVALLRPRPRNPTFNEVQPPTGAGVRLQGWARRLRGWVRRVLAASSRARDSRPGGGG